MDQKGGETLLNKPKVLSNFPMPKYSMYSKPFLYNEPYLKEYCSPYGQKKYKLTFMYCIKNKEIETSTERCSKNNQKLESNLQRSRSKIYEYAFCNKWDYFFTGTLDKTKANREDLRGFKKSFNLFIKHFNRKYNCNVIYLLIPELHSDMKSWHFHGFLAGLPDRCVKKFYIGDKMSRGIAEKIFQGDSVFHWIDWDKKFRIQ